MTVSRIRIAIIGAGLCGLATAARLRLAGHYVVVFEKEPTMTELGAGINLFPNALALFRSWGLYSEIEKHGTTYDHMSIMSYKDGEELAGLNERLIPREITIHRVDLLQILSDEAKRCGVIVRYGVNLVDISSSSPSGGRPTLELSTGEVSEWDVILGADGERSQSRAFITGQTVSQHDNGNDVYRTTLPLTKVLEDEELRPLFERSRKNFWLGPGGNVLIYPLKHDDLLNVVTTQEHPAGTTPLWHPQNKPVSEVLQYYRDWDPRLQKLFSMSPTYKQWTMLTTPPILQWTSLTNDMALVGDAAHPTAPYLGQGAAMGFEDAAVLGTLFTFVTSPQDIPAALTIYEGLRKPRVTAMLKRTAEQIGVYNLRDGPEQEERDDRFRAGLSRHHPFFMMDTALHEWLYYTDVSREARMAWKCYAAVANNKIPPTTTTLMK